MMNLKSKVEVYLGRKFCPCTEVAIRHGEDGVDRIVFWSSALARPKPTEAELDEIKDAPPATPALSVFAELNLIKARLDALESRG